MSLIGHEAAVMRKTGNVKSAWVAHEVVTIDHETDGNVRANHALYAKPGFEMRQSSSPTSSKSAHARLSFIPSDLAEARVATKQRNEEAQRRQQDRNEKEEWLRQIKPAMAMQIVNYIHSQDSEPVIRLLADGLSEDELKKVCLALNLNT